MSLMRAFDHVIAHNACNFGTSSSYFQARLPSPCLVIWHRTSQHQPHLFQQVWIRWLIILEAQVLQAAACFARHCKCSFSAQIRSWACLCSACPFVIRLGFAICLRGCRLDNLFTWSYQQHASFRNLREWMPRVTQVPVCLRWPSSASSCVRNRGPGFSALAGSRGQWVAV